jgi:hypothetical protein
VLLIGGLLVAAIVITALIPIPLSDSFVRKYGDAMDWWSWSLAGRHSLNCGRVEMGHDSVLATNCGIDAWARGLPFRVRYDTMGGYSPLSVGLVRTPKGRMLALSFVGDASGGEGTSLWGERVDVQSCPLPAHLYLSRLGTVMNCFPAELSYPPDQSRLDRIIQDLRDLLDE